MIKGRHPYFLSICFLFWGLSAGLAQIQSPELSCVKNDTLFWNPVVNNCGPFISYSVFYSTSPNGPFSLLADLNNESDDFLHHPNPGNEPFYYYIIGNYDCPGEPTISSDTISNQPLSIIRIKQVSVENGLAEIMWYPSENKEVSTYIIYKSTPLGTIPIDTVYDVFSYTDPFSDVNNKSESYFVIGLNDCGANSSFDLPHTSVFATFEVDPCERSIIVNWNAYSSWENSVREQILWLSIDNGPEQNYLTLDSNINSARITDLDENNTYCFTIRAYEDNSDAFSSSNTLCIQPDIVQPMKAIQVTNLTVNSNETLDLLWRWNDDAELAEALILQAENMDPLNPYQNIDHNNLMIDNTLEILVNPGEAFYRYEIISRDQCDSLVSSSVAQALRLFASEQPDDAVFLYWSGFKIPNAEVIYYEVFRNSGNGFLPIANLSPTDSSFTDPTTDLATNISEYCYRIAAHFQLNLMDGTSIQNTAISNTKCIYEEIEIWFPNAFAPSGLNQIFKPMIKHPGSISNYHLEVFDRWGAHVFSSSDPTEGWNGYKNGRIMNPGVYTYLSVIHQENGRQITKTGQVLLLR